MRLDSCPTGGYALWGHFRDCGSRSRSGAGPFLNPANSRRQLRIWAVLPQFAVARRLKQAEPYSSHIFTSYHGLHAALRRLHLIVTHRRLELPLPFPLLDAAPEVVQVVDYTTTSRAAQSKLLLNGSRIAQLVKSEPFARLRACTCCLRC